jgi:hypothetical protein
LLEALKGIAATSVIVTCSATLTACETDDPFAVAAEPISATVHEPVTVRVYSHPYEAVDWATDRRLLAQQHDHVARRLDWILAYDTAGYDVVSLMDYSGNALLPYALRERPWPANAWVPATLPLKNIELFIPNGEEVGIPGEPMRHVTSPFLTEFIEGVPNPPWGVPEQPLLPRQYRSIEGLFTLVRSLGGFPCLAHPWNFDFRRLRLGDSYCIEIFNAQADFLNEQGVPYYTAVDRNQAVITAWDAVLHENQLVFGIAVNDHIGPGSSLATLSNKIRDSGKVVVLAKEATLPAYERAFRAGRFFAVRDYGETKGSYPTVQDIVVTEAYIYIATTGSVRWIAEGKTVGNEPLLQYTSVPYNAHYVRAEISAENGTTVYTQAFALRPVGDFNGDYTIDDNDEVVCSTTSRSPAATRACAAAGLP